MKFVNFIIIYEINQFHFGIQLADQIFQINN